MSSEKLLNNAIRHQRLCNQVVGAEKLGAAIQIPINNLKEKYQLSQDRMQDKTADYDNVVLRDTILDDVIRDISDAAKQYDRKNVGRGIYTLLFPDGKTQSIIKASMTKEPDKAEQLLLRFNNFEEDDAMLVHKEPLSKTIADARTAISVYEQAITNEKKALAEEAMAKDDLVRQYEFNFHDAAKLFGKKFANRLFPKTPRTKKEVPTEVVVTE